ncbi:hypothetical protein TWF481_005489 [Arthrobotrys musiformis]|uniref:Zona occludens toxin N-terminal domain-containing protein n=1 Tax=Arthrobotrys musiformis TaxID=47236 RepID=A0AAV9WF36_9PEZI
MTQKLDDAITKGANSLDQLNKTDKNLLLCWLYDGIYQHLSGGLPFDVNSVCELAAQLPRSGPLINYSGGIIGMTIAAHAKFDNWKTRPMPKKKVKALFPHWKQWKHPASNQPPIQTANPAPTFQTANPAPTFQAPTAPRAFRAQETYAAPGPSAYPASPPPRPPSTFPSAVAVENASYTSWNAPQTPSNHHNGWDNSNHAHTHVWSNGQGVEDSRGERAYPTPKSSPKGGNADTFEPLKGKAPVRSWETQPIMESTHPWQTSGDDVSLRNLEDDDVSAEDLFETPTKSLIEDLLSKAYLLFLDKKSQSNIEGTLKFAPLFTSDTVRGTSSEAIPPQSAILGEFLDSGSEDSSEQRLIMLNTNTPWMAFICGLQGAGKSHTLTVMLENSLIPHGSVNILRKPLAGMVFHYAAYHSGVSMPCEAAHLANTGGNSRNPALKVTVLVSRSNFISMKAAYANIPNITIKEFMLNPSQLTINTMLHLMSVQDSNGALYIQIVHRVLRDIKYENDTTGSQFDYKVFKQRIFREGLTGMQRGPLEQRLSLLESFIAAEEGVNNFAATPGALTIVDLTCPFVDAETACVLFSICNELFTSAPCPSGKIIALDEAHRYMSNTDGGTATAAVQRFAESIISNIRLQRHLGMRTIISTQDPFVHPELLELASMVVLHRFSSPRWFEFIKKHVGFDTTPSQEGESSPGGWDEENRKEEVGMFKKIANLNTGEAYVYCPQMLVAETIGWGGATLKKFGNVLFKMATRAKITVDGGASRNVF